MNRIRNERYRERHRERVRKTSRESAVRLRAEDPERRRHYAKQAADRRAANPEHHREINRRSNKKRRARLLAEDPVALRAKESKYSVACTDRLWARNPQLVMWRNAKTRARLYGCVFEIMPEDIIIPECCPVFGTPLRYKGGMDAPSLDKIRPELGYVRGNIAVISKRANVLKGNCTSPEQIRKVADWFEAQLERAP
jgi:hypothetical protein